SAGSGKSLSWSSGLRPQSTLRCVPAFSRLQPAIVEGRTDDLVFIVFDVLFLNGNGTATLPLVERKEWLRALFARPIRASCCWRSHRGQWPALLSRGLSTGRRRRHLEADRQALRSWQSRPMAQAEMSDP